MNKQQQIEIFDQTNERLKAILMSKGDDYAGEDRLKNFKLVAMLEGRTPKENIYSQICNKIARLGNLFSTKKEPNNESIEDTILDSIGYFHLLYMAMQEEKKESDTPIPSDDVITVKPFEPTEMNNMPYGIRISPFREYPQDIKTNWKETDKPTTKDDLFVPHLTASPLISTIQPEYDNPKGKAPTMPWDKMKKK